MSSTVIGIAQDIANAVSGLEVDSVLLSASVDLAPDFDFSTLRERRIVVTPQSYSRSNATRGESALSAKINLCVCEKIELADVDDRLALVELIARHLERRSLSRGIVTAIEFDPIYDAQLLRTSHIFVSICIVTVKVIR